MRYILPILFATLIGCVNVPMPEKIMTIDYIEGSTITCTAVPVAPRVLITAAHCTIPGNPVDISVVGVNNGKSTAFVQSIIRPEPYINPTKDPRGLHTDIAILVTDKPLPKDTLFYRLDTSLPSDLVEVQGYKHGKEFVSKEVTVNIKADDAFTVDYLFWTGMSGGPVIDSYDPYKVYGVISVRGVTESVAVRITPEFKLLVEDIIDKTKSNSHNGL